MPNSLQLLLSSRPPRTLTAQDQTLSLFGGAWLCDFKQDPQTGVKYIQSTTKMNFVDSKGVLRKPPDPPIHMHLSQTESFKVLKGRIIATMGGKEILLSPEDDEYSSPPGEWHTFKPDEKAGDLEVIVKGTPECGDHGCGFGEKFYRNFQSYLSDCCENNTSPSPFQMMLFLHSAGVVLKTPLPLEVAKGLHWFLGVVVGEWLLGYKSSYPEYYDEKKNI